MKPPKDRSIGEVMEEADWYIKQGGPVPVFVATPIVEALRSLVCTCGNPSDRAVNINECFDCGLDLG